MSYEYKTQGYTVVDAGRRLVVDPVTRIEGHLRCEVNINDDNVITNAVSCGTIFRGIEIILKGRDPRDAWAFTERICGVCTGTHALASVHAVENALGIDIPDNANIIRNLMQLCLMYHDHLVHLYQLTGLDWVDVVSASKADPKATSELAQKLSPWPNSSPGYFKSVKDKLLKLINSNQLGIFTNGYWGHPAYKLSPEANLMVVAHYIEALDFQKDVVHIHTIFGGKNPHPNWLVGACPARSTLTAWVRPMSSIRNAWTSCFRSSSAAVPLPSRWSFRTRSLWPAFTATGSTSAAACPNSRCWPMAAFPTLPTTIPKTACSCLPGPSSTATSTKCCP